MIELRPPTSLTTVTSPAIFLAGSIEMGKAKDWQQVVVEKLQDIEGTLLNPRRAAWDATWPQEASFPPFREQVEWELSGLDMADMVVFNFEPTTKSPITLLELGILTAHPNKNLVCCPPGFWRKGNVDIVCQRFGVPMFETLNELIDELRKRLPHAT